MKADWKDDIFEGEHRKYNLIENEDGTVSLQDATDYTQQGDAFGAKELNAIAAEVNETKKSVSDGKTLIAAAITEKKVKTAADATFAVMAENIGKIICGSGTATPADVLKGVTFTGNDGIEKTGTLEVQSILSFSAAPYSSTQITFTWKNPAKGPFSGVIIVGKTGSYPTSISDGKRWYKGSGNNSAPSGSSSATVSGFTGGTTYYFRAFSYSIKDGDEWIHKTSYTATAATTKGMQVFTESGVFTVPASVRSIDIFCVGGGGAGGDDYRDTDSAGTGGGGGGGYTATKKAYSVTPGQTFAVTIGAGGTVVTGNTGNTGGTTSFGSVLSAEGGKGGEENRSGSADGGAGGSGGGGAAGTGSYAVYGKGGSDGSDGYGTAKIGTGFYGGTGQGTTTRAFGEADGTLYAGGGGAYNGSSAGGAGAGGDGGGGKGRVAGTANTGGGGGGNGEYTNNKGSAGAGGSGICIVRWGY